MSRALSLAALSWLWLAACGPDGGASLEVVLRSDLSSAERAGARFEVDVVSASDGTERGRALVVDAAGLEQERLTSVGGTLLGAITDLEVGRHELRLRVVRGETSVPVDVAAVDFVGRGAQQVILTVLREASPPCDADTRCAESACATATCIDGACFVLRDEAWTEACACDEDADCGAAPGCNVHRCRDHTCVLEPDDTRCAPRERCGADGACDPVTCRGRNAGDVCRPAANACDEPETCPGPDGDCPEDGLRELGVACVDDDTGRPGFCALTDDGLELRCDIACETGSVCQVGCRSGTQVCAPEPRCELSGAVGDGVTCGRPELCRDAPSCLDGVCTLGLPRVGEVCGEDPAPECIAAPRCAADGSCRATPEPAGTPCTTASAPTCYAPACNGGGACVATPVTSSPSCRGPAYDGSCAVLTCQPSGVTGTWGCSARPDHDRCATEACTYDTECVLFYSSDLGPTAECREGEPRCRRSDGETVSCADGDPLATCDLWGPCSDGERGGTETDVDCGGLECSARCGAGGACLVTDDCLLYMACIDGVCVE